MTDFVFNLAPTNKVDLGLVDTLADDVQFVLAPFMRGVQGDPGPAGAGAGPIQTLTATAGIALGGHRVVGIDHSGTYSYVSNAVHADALRAAGITLGAADLGAAVNVQTKGPITEPSWNWTADQPVFLGTNGLLTQTVPTSGGGAVFLLNVGVAMTATTLFVQLANPIFV